MLIDNLKICFSPESGFCLPLLNNGIKIVILCSLQNHGYFGKMPTNATAISATTSFMSLGTQVVTYLTASSILLWPTSYLDPSLPSSSPSLLTLNNLSTTRIFSVHSLPPSQSQAWCDCDLFWGHLHSLIFFFLMRKVYRNLIIFQTPLFQAQPL